MEISTNEIDGVSLIGNRDEKNEKHVFDSFGDGGQSSCQHSLCLGSDGLKT